MLLTLLYVPGDRPDRFAKAVASGADAVILDLEDAVAPARKPYAREAVADFLGAPQPVPVQVRVNELGGPDIDADLAAVAGLAGGLRLPKVESAAALPQLDVPLHVLVESARGLEHAYEIASAGVASVGLGEADLRSDLGVTADEGLLWARGRIVTAARAAGLPPPVMSVHPDVADLDGLAASCAAGRRLGFLGRAAIHPRQLPVIAEAFRPAPAEVARAEELLAALAGATARDSGTVVLPDGRFADRAMVAEARRTIDLAARFA